MQTLAVSLKAIPVHKLKMFQPQRTLLMYYRLELLKQKQVVLVQITVELIETSEHTVDTD
jgi:hypothetical protein